MSLQNALSASVPWPEFASVVLGLASGELPTKVECPTCGGNMHVFEDTTNAGAWHHCFECGQGGDLFQLAAAMWNLPLDAVGVRLRQEGMPVPDAHLTPEFVAGHMSLYAEAEGVSQFWESSREYLLKQQRSEVLGALKNRFRLQASFSDDRWRAGPGLCVGAAPKAALFRHLSNRVKSQFRGRGWGDVLLVPYQSMPGRVCAFLAVGREGNQGDRQYVRLASGDGRRNQHAEFGLAGLPYVLGQPSDIVAVNDAMLMLRLQVRHFGTSTVPLPLVAWHDSLAGRSWNTWDCLRGRRVIFWTWSLDEKVWMQAIHTDGEISTVGPETGDQKTIDHYVRLLSTGDLLKRIRKNSRPWHVVLSETICAEGSDWAGAFFHRLERAGVSLQGVRARLSPQASNLVGAALVEHAEDVGVPFQGGRIFERGHGWYYQSANAKKPPHLVSSFTLRIEHVEDTGPYFFYHGHMHVNGEPLPVRFSARSIRFDPQNTYQTVAHKHRKGTVYIRGGWAAKLVQIALAFHQPCYASNEAASLLKQGQEATRRHKEGSMPLF